MRIAAIATVLALALTACSGGNDQPAASPSDDATGAATAVAEDASGDVERGPIWIVVDGEEHALEADLCFLGDDGVRELWAYGSGGFPAFSVSSLPPDFVSVEYTGPEGAASYRTNDASAVSLDVTDGGATGTAILASLSGQDDPVTIEFGFECLEQDPVQADGDDASDDADADADAGTAAGGESTKSGYVEWAGARSDLTDEDFDPFAGTGLCETEDVTGTEGDDYFRIVTTLDDGTDFSLTSRDGLVLGDTFDPIETSIADLTKSGGTVSGSADTPTGPLNFSFTC
ncbi:hypothetical protein [uncultured Demequina sp.]|uniref:hypothetical protein n=1 Tax=uncultured Demequina sp. TaxID=693499 RepID=UPI0025ED6310|nr:hypothetical protein [uncultured Demequina sp.]